ncbi:MAG: SurA N-terminal domain-containing protein [Desulfobacterales bacterium]
MGKKSIYFLMIILFSFLSCCTQEKKANNKTLAKINDYVLTLDEFQTQLADEVRLDKDFKLTKVAKKDFLDQLITKEVLIQEAKKRNLDRKEKFIRAIERYWESTLIKDLMEAEGKNIAKRTVVSQEEIETRYNDMKKSDQNLPRLESIRDEISKKIMEEKKRRLLKEWTDQLIKRAKIDINEKLLSGN